MNSFRVPRLPKSWGPAKEPSAAERALRPYVEHGGVVNKFDVPVVANLDRLISEHPLVGYVDSDFAGRGHPESHGLDMFSSLMGPR